MKKSILTLGAALMCASIAIADCVSDAVSNPVPGIENQITNSRIVFERTGKGTVAFLGGSITEMNGFRPIIMESLKKRFPKTQFSFTSQGKGSTCSDTGAFRLEEDILTPAMPDLLFVEFAVNDNQDGNKTKEESIRAMEGIVRHALKANPCMDIIISLLVNDNHLHHIQKGIAPTAYLANLKVAGHYGIPVANIGAELANRIAAGTFTKKQYGDCHPDPAGNRLVADVQERIFDAASFGKPFTGGELKRHSLPKPLDPLCYENGRFLPFDRVWRGEGWLLSKPDVSGLKCHAANRYQLSSVNLHAYKPGAMCSFSFEGNAAGLYVTTSSDVGMLDVSVDGGPSRRLSLWRSTYSKTLHYPFTLMLAENLKDGPHTITMTIAPEKHPDSSGHACRVYRVCINGK